MNVRFSRQEIRFRVSREEFETLRVARVLCGETLSPGGVAFRYEARVWEKDSGIVWSAGCLVLNLSEAELHRLAKTPPSKKNSGIEFEVPLEGGLALRVSFEIDLFSSSLRAQSRLRDRASDS